MLRNGLCVQKFFSTACLALTLLSLTACAPGMRDPWNTKDSGSSSQTTTEAIPADAPLTPPAPQVAQASLPAKVAILLPLSGKSSDTGQSMLNAAQLAIFDLGATTFELIPRDTLGTPEGARAAAQAAMAEGAQLILGPVFSADAKAVAPLAIQNGIGVVSFSTDSSVAGGTSFVMGFLPQTQIRQIIDFAAAQGMPRIALIAGQDAYGTITSTAFDTYIRQRNLMNAGILRYSGSTPTPEQIKAFATAQAGAAGGKPFDAVLIAAPGAQAAMISQQLTQAGLPPANVQRLGTGLWDQADVLRYPALQGAWYATSSQNLRQKFEARYEQTYGVSAPRLATLAYDATALAIVLARSGQTYTRQTLSNPNGFTGIDGIFRFHADGLVERGLAILEIGNNTTRVIKPAPTSFMEMN